MNENYLKRWGTISSVLCLAIIFLVNDFYFYNNRAFKENKFLFDENTINLGLDLRGGSEFILSPRIDKWIINNHQANISDGKNLATAIDDLKKSNDLFTLENFFIYLSAYDIGISDIFPGEDINSLSRNINIALNSNKDIIRKRIDTRGVIEPTVRVVGNKISVEIPGDQSVENIESLITTSASLNFKQVLNAPPQGPLTIDNISIWQRSINNFVLKFPSLRQHISIIPDFLDTQSGKIDFIYLKKENINLFKDAVDQLKIYNLNFESRDFGYFAADNRFDILDLQFDTGDIWLGLLSPVHPNISGEMVSNASLQSDGTSSAMYVILLEFNNTAERKWFNYTSKNIGEKVAITLDGEVLTYPTIQSAISGSSQISGFDDYLSAENITIALNNGKFNLPLQIDSIYKSGPELGEKMITLGLIAFFCGIACVIIFMICYYKISGLIASAALLINILLMTSILSILGSTLTLPGIAGFILTVGIAVDANVIIFERIKEEIKNGTPYLSAIESGYSRAFITILDANITTILTALILYFFGTGPIKGFAITLTAGILCSMFTAIYITKTIFMTISQTNFYKKIKI